MLDRSKLPPVTQAVPTKLAVWADQSGAPYLVQHHNDGSTTITPLETVLAQQQPQTTTTRATTDHNPLNAFLLGIVVVLGLVLGGYLIGFVAGATGQRVVLVPSMPVCSTHRSSFLFWSTENKECQ